MSTYKDVQALLICWEKAQPPTFRDQRGALEKVLNNPYNFGTKPIDIPDQNPYGYLIAQIGEFKHTHDNDNTLLILYYGGHGDVCDGRLMLKCYSAEKLTEGTYAPWAGAQELLVTTSKADILFILDCCHAASAIEGCVATGNKVVDIFLASSIEGKAPLRDEYSLTSKLTNLLKSRALSKRGFHTWFLQKRLVLYQIAKGRLDSLEADDNAELGTTPFWFHDASDSQSDRHILIHRLDRRDGSDDDDGDDESDSKSIITTSRPAVDRRPSVILFTSEAPTGTESRAKSRPPVNYADAATNTKPDLFIALAALPQGLVQVEYTDSATNTEPEAAPREGSSQRIQRGSGSNQHVQPQRLSSSFPLRASWSISLPLSQISRRSTMGIETLENDYPRESEIWFRRYFQWASIYDQPQHGRSLRPRIAILCTGVSLKDDGGCFREARRDRRIFQKDFSESGGRDGGADFEDTHGMGTHCVRLLVKLNRSAELHVLKITDRQKGFKLSVVNNAILYAVREKKVDMIVLPLGFTVRSEETSAAISEALLGNIICIAAPGNSGGNDRLAFPARMPGVIPVYATDGFGNPCPFNPSPLKDRKNFSTIGESISSRWGGEEVVIRGTAYSACVAAAMLATVLDFARNHLSLDAATLSVLKSPQGAEKLLEMLSSERGGYDYVTPWLFFTDEYEGTMEEMSESEFKSVMRGQITAALRQL
ncbi:hypothetical protein MAPG_10516 [Magnaporthiopsis poae ATCC 64411]|uniref:Uncharacterized protein n=1 Tax=Magnaporthiopsis poae (strain ATCC 64411 / 73-15) TaxID=644358 RepID=A0A0C4ECT1_MAGP6|nr:hypothetical protein MAPG_10516 [Magnaporthiopsis poae ATCC 64411]